MPSSVNIDYAYLFASDLSNTAGSERRLSLATSGGVERNPYFFSGRFTNPKESADILLVLSAISRTRFFSASELQARMLAAADPVVTSDGSQIRFEAFSGCCGAYARYDLRSAGIDGDWLGKGTTNVDFNPPMRAALGSVMSSEAVKLRIGADQVELERGMQTIIERKVKLPVRWLKGFVEVQIYQARLERTIEVPASEFLRVVRTLPKQSIVQTGTVTYLVPNNMSNRSNWRSSSSLRISQRDTRDAIPVGAISRLKVLEPILRYAKSVRLYRSDDCVFACELVVSGGSFYLVLSPNAARGFSGEGQALSSLAQCGELPMLKSIQGALAWQAKLNPATLATTLDIDPKSVEYALQVLGTRGLVGYDLSTSAFYHRELPFDLSLIEELHPRMKKARDLFDNKRVRLVKTEGLCAEAYVVGSKADHYVSITDDGVRCTCEWYTKYQGNRGPCSHILATELVIGGESDR